MIFCSPRLFIFHIGVDTFRTAFSLATLPFLRDPKTKTVDIKSVRLERSFNWSLQTIQSHYTCWEHRCVLDSQHAPDSQILYCAHCAQGTNEGLAMDIWKLLTEIHATRHRSFVFDVRHGSHGEGCGDTLRKWKIKKCNEQLEVTAAHGIAFISAIRNEHLCWPNINRLCAYIINGCWLGGPWTICCYYVVIVRPHRVSKLCIIWNVSSGPLHLQSRRRFYTS